MNNPALNRSPITDHRSPSNVNSTLNKPVQYLKGVGPRRAFLLQKLGIHKVADLLHHFPRYHDDRSQCIPIARVQPGTRKTLQGRVEEFHVDRVGKQILMGKALISDGTGMIWAVWFRRASPRYDPFQSW